MESARMGLGLAAAVLVPWSLGWDRARPRTMVLATLVAGLYAIASVMDEERAWYAFAVALLASAAVAIWSQPWPSASISLPLYPGTSITAGRRLSASLGGVALLTALWTVGPPAAGEFERLLLSDRAAITAACFLLAVFCGGKVVLALTIPIRREVDAMPAGPQRDGAHDFINSRPQLGWIERGLLYSFLVAGQPEAAALVLAAKSLARLPSLEHGGKHASEFFLAGTLGSVGAALAMSVAARSAMGLSAL